MKWSEPPPLAVVSGKQTYLVRREARRAKTSNRGRRLERFDGDDYGAIHDTVSTSMMLDFQDVFVLVEKAEKLPATDALIEHLQAGDNSIAVLLVIEGDPPGKGALTKLLKALPEEHHLKFGLPKPWDVAKEAVAFCVQEAKEFGCRLNPKTASLLVSVVGTDYGVLSYEIQKAAALARSQGSKEIDRKDLGRTIAPVFQQDSFPVADALASKDGAIVLRNLGMVERSSKDDPTMKICGLLGNRIALWIKAAHLVETGYDPDEAAGRLGTHPFRFKKELLPITRRWKSQELIALLRGVASVERGVKTGRANPWIQLSSTLFQACGGRS